MNNETTNTTEKFGPGVYLIGDIKTFSKRTDIQDLEEGIHTLEDGAKVAIIRVPEHADDVLIDQNENTFAIDSGYVGVIRADYLPTSVLTEFENQQDNEDTLPQFSFETILEPFTPQRIDDPLHEGDTVIALGGTFLSTNVSEPGEDDVIFDDDEDDDGEPPFDDEEDDDGEPPIDYDLEEDDHVDEDYYDDEEDDYEEEDDDLDR